ncbi:MAG: STAS-like domain-containing protein [Oscillatoria sp. PMC 1051.18]|nr:STAS-like domain-containing protein [Oscillatoria sp. PMC 1050.18]MEC5031967.1 STAS-like domain-containing protein [Oscillatoria sp. PMC 1051.18]
MRIEIHTLVGKNCMTREDGQMVYDRIHSELLAEHPIELDFENVEIFASPFFNFAIGQLLRDIEPDSLNHLLKISNLNPVGKPILKRVIENSKKYYSDDEYRSKVDKVISQQATSD